MQRLRVCSHGEEGEDEAEQAETRKGARVPSLNGEV